MNDRECYRKLILRRKLNRQIGEFHRPLSCYDARQRARIEDLSFRFRTLDAEITAHVLARGAVRVNGSVLVPTADRLDFVELDADTLRPRGFPFSAFSPNPTTIFLPGALES